MARTATISTKISPELKAAIDQAAKDDGRSTSQWLERLIVKALQEDGRWPQQSNT